jgi:hypothetical protein
LYPHCRLGQIAHGKGLHALAAGQRESGHKEWSTCAAQNQARLIILKAMYP